VRTLHSRITKGFCVFGVHERVSHVMVGKQKRWDVTFITLFAQISILYIDKDYTVDYAH
jgi:hypothetical protein